MYGCWRTKSQSNLSIKITCYRSIMKKILIRYGLIGGFLMLLFAYATLVPYLNIYFSESIVNISKFVVIAGVGLYGINAYLKSGGNIKYNYGVGFLICLGIGVIAATVYSVIFVLVNYSQYNIVENLPKIISRLILFAPLIIFCSLLIPLFFLFTKKKIVRDDDEVLDSNF